jgi:hypothetical protein
LGFGEVDVRIKKEFVHDSVMTKSSIVLCLVLWATACSSSSTPTAPTPPPAGTTPQAYVANLVPDETLANSEQVVPRAVESLQSGR